MMRSTSSREWTSVEWTRVARLSETAPVGLLLAAVGSAVLTFLEPSPASPVKEALSTYENKRKTCTIHNTQAFLAL